MAAIFSVFMQWVFSFFAGKLFGQKSESEKRGEEVVENYREGDKIDAQPDINSDALRKWFKRLRK